MGNAYDMKADSTPTMYALQFLLVTYKMGYYILKQQFASIHARNTLQWLTKSGYIETFDLGLYGESLILRLTSKGSKYVQDNFVHYLTSGRLNHIYPIVCAEDLIQVTSDLANTQDIKFVKTPHVVVPAGVYVVKQIDKFSVLITNQENTAKYRIHTYKAREYLKLLMPTTITDVSAEMVKRFGLINVKSLSKQLIKVVPKQLQLIEFMNHLYSASNTKDRLNFGV